MGRRAVCLVGLGLAVCGCASQSTARYVYQDGDFGVIAIPRNTFLGRIDYRAQAELLMCRHFPEGHEIVRAEEVIEGQRTLDRAQKTEIDAGPNFAVPGHGVRFGHLERMTSYEEKDRVELRECRIIYMRKSTGAAERPGPFASIASLTPDWYLDPNEAIRRQAGTARLVNAGPASNRASDPGAAKVSTSPLR